MNLYFLVVKNNNSVNNVKQISWLRTFILVAFMALPLISCDDEVNSVFSTKYRVRCGFLVVNHAELINCIDNLGQFSTIRQSGSKIKMASSVSNTEYNVDEISKDYYYGLGGLIIGTPTSPLDGQPYRAYDLACPNCDRNNYRLSVDVNGWAKCSHCGITYDLNSDGVILDKGESNFQSPRSLYRYRINYDGMRVHVYN